VINNMIRTIKRVGVLGVSILAFGLVLTGSQVAWAKHAPAHASFAPIVPSSSVTACGTLALSDTIYLVTVPLTQVGTGDCIVLTGSNDTLDFQSNNVTGPGTGTSTGAGIRITGAEDVVEGTNNTVSGFAVGVLDQGTDTSGDQVNMVGNGIGLKMTSVGAGIGAGATELWTNFSTTNNVAQGVFMNGCNDECMIAEFDASFNGADGVLVQNSQGPRINIFTADSNGGDGVHIGCTSSCGANSTVKVVDAPIGLSSDVAVTGNTGDGIFLDVSEAFKKDQVVLVEAMSNGDGIATFDLHDATSTCGLNHWVHNDWGTADAAGVPSPPCIPPSGL
jgi:hypothetical protein